MRILIEFDTDGIELHPISYARMMLDIQHMAIVCRAIAEDRLRADDIVFDWYKRKYTWMIEATEEEIGMAELTITRIDMGSLLVELTPKKLAKNMQKAFAGAFRYIANHLLFIDLEREKRSIENQLKREEVLEKRIENVAAALKLINKIPDEHLRDEFIESLRSSVLPFTTEHPPVKSVKLIKETDGEDVDDIDDEFLDDIDSEAKPH
jgi:hypothetical protein